MILRPSCFPLFQLLLLSLCHSGTPFPITLIQLPGSIFHEKLGKIYNVGKVDCGLLCKYTPLCRGIIYKSSENSCQMIQFIDYLFLAAADTDEIVYIRQWSFANETEFNFNLICPTEETRNRYMERIETLDEMQAAESHVCANDISYYIRTDEKFAEIRVNYRETSKVAVPCDSSRGVCYHGCTNDQYLILGTTDGSTYLRPNSAIWPAYCYNGRWMLFDVETQQLMPVDQWRCTADMAVCPQDESWTFERGRCWYKKNWSLLDGRDSWDDSKERCKQKNSTLVKILNEDDFSALQSLLVDFFFVAINVIRNESGLYDTDGVKYGDDSFVAQNLLKVPYVAGNNYGMVEIDNSQILFDAKTSDYQGVVCEYSKTVPKQRPADYARYEELMRTN